MELITQKLHKGIFSISKEGKCFRISCCSPVGLLWHLPTSRSIRSQGESTCPVRVSALGSQAHEGSSAMQGSSVMYLHPENPDTFCWWCLFCFCFCFWFWFGLVFILFGFGGGGFVCWFVCLFLLYDFFFFSGGTNPKSSSKAEIAAHIGDSIREALYRCYPGIPKV